MLLKLANPEYKGILMGISLNSEIQPTIDEIIQDLKILNAQTTRLSGLIMCI